MLRLRFRTPSTIRSSSPPSAPTLPSCARKPISKSILNTWTPELAPTKPCRSKLPRRKRRTPRSSTKGRRSSACCEFDAGPSADVHQISGGWRVSLDSDYSQSPPASSRAEPLFRRSEGSPNHHHTVRIQTDPLPSGSFPHSWQTPSLILVDEPP